MTGITVCIRIGQCPGLHIPDSDGLRLLQHEGLFIRNNPSQSTDGTQDGIGFIPALFAANRVGNRTVSK